MGVCSIIWQKILDFPMVHFLLYRESNELAPVRKALESGHDLTFAKDLQQALTLLECTHFDMIISAVFLESGDMFTFLRAVKERPSLKSVPFICFSARQTKRARILNETLSGAALTSGADAFLQLDDYCKDETCDLGAIRQAIEKQLPAAHSS